MWKPDDGSLSNPNINNPVAKPTTTTIYTVYGYDHNGCLDSAYVHVIVDSTMTEDIPSGFTPNGDGLNDVFRPVGLKFQNIVEFRVYNRWGQQLFYSNNPKVGWDGTFNGVPQDLGVYYYVIIAGRPGGDGVDVTYKGEVTLIR
jgi:gliding motility-associated-like protein